ncbi:MAG: formate dehydrogenase accessory sulfurtransferase FdhD [Desulforhabdus sp.]|jgi:FdhD protein|nr:formate dehydrogenase accessory sulfurtransferase FdhD [Desulforhabdus sp.]
MELPDRDRDELAIEKALPVAALIYDKQGVVERDQWVIKEQPVTLYLNGREVVTLLCAGHHLEELAVGFFFGEGFLKRRTDLQDVHVDGSAGKVEVTVAGDPSLVESLWQKRTVTSGCGKGSLFYFSIDALLSKPVSSSLTFSPQQVRDRVEDLNRMSGTYRRTHGVHNTALASPDEIVLFRDDIGRHNAVDMIVGYAFLHDISLHDMLLITTGRLTSEILIKAAKVGIPVLISRNTATSLAIELAKALNITLIGYVRAGRFTLYSGSQRVG